MAKIYTKVGDKGQTALVGGQKVAKSDARIEAYGTIDELNSVLGWVRVALDKEVFENLNADLERLQHWLFDLGGLLAAEPADREKYALTPISSGHVKWLEEKIDQATAVLPPLREFILPGGSEAASRLHVARTVTRRAERAMIALDPAHLPENAVPFLNRISDYFFTIARWTNQLEHVADVTWKKAVTPS